MKNILVVGERFLPLGEMQDCRIHYCSDPRSINMYAQDCVLYYFSGAGWSPIDLVLWRCQFDKDLLSEQRILEIILQTNVICINNALSCLSYCHTAIMNHAIKELGLPALQKTYFFGSDAPYMIDMNPLSKVLKVGEFHGGYGKALIDHDDEFIDTIDIAVKLKESISLEDYIPYVKDIRALYIDGNISLYERVPSNWKANVAPKNVIKIEASCVPDFVLEGTIALATKIHADIIGVDWIQSKKGTWFILEGNMSPGIEDPQDCKELAKLIDKRVFTHL